jgi:hypothetical protein
MNEITLPIYEVPCWYQGDTYWAYRDGFEAACRQREEERQRQAAEEEG